MTSVQWKKGIKTSFNVAFCLLLKTSSTLSAEKVPQSSQIPLVVNNLLLFLALPLPLQLQLFSTTALSTSSPFSVADNSVNQLPLNLSSPVVTDPHQLSPSTSPSATPVTGVVPFIEWTLKNRRPYPFTTEISNDLGVEVKKIKVFEVEGIVTTSYLRADAFAHSNRTRA